MTLAGAGVAWLIVGLTLANVVSGAGAVIGLLFYLRPLEIFVGAEAIRSGGHDAR